ncbi:NACHT domain protein [Aspergillus sclerotialis]|uniref:NACHT domain protein n=1 Tax=Aspergillus sclerotialis TaxID=2070753 RepID=A0A3A2ZC03_9EURO|nr:NACHT domain protein [Aspergillus sclerotialis]
MAPSILSPTPSATPGLMSPGSRRVSGFQDSDTLSNGSLTQSFFSRRVSSRKFSKQETTSVSSYVSSLKRQSGDELGPATSSQLFNVSHASLMDWIRNQRMTLLPPEGSDYDKVLAWAALFVGRLNEFDLAIDEFAGESEIAAQMAYGYCAMLLDLGRENARALMTSFGFFYNISMSLVNLLDRTELFTVNHEIRELLGQALGDLVTLVASVSIHFHKAIRGLSGSSVSVDLYRTFSGQIQTFRQRCEKVALFMWRHQLLKENVDVERVSEIHSIRSWLSPDDRVLTNVAETTSHLAHDREELTCLWMGQYLVRFLKSPLKTLSIAGKPGSGKTVLGSVIVDNLQHPISGVHYNVLFVPINARIPAETTPRAVARTILSQLFALRIGNVQLFHILTGAFERSKFITSEDEYDNLLWNTLESALAAVLYGANPLVIVVDGIDESTCGEAALLKKLTSAAAKGPNVKLITLGAERPQETQAEGQTCVQITEDLIFDDISAVVRSHFTPKSAFAELDEMERETVVSRITEASNGSFLWAKLATKYLRSESKPDGLRKTLDALIKSKPSVYDFVLQTIQGSKVTAEAKQMLLWLATVERPLQVKELATLASVQVDKQLVPEKEVDVLDILLPLNSLIFLQDDLVYLRHGSIRAAVLEAFSKGKLTTTIKDRHADLVTKLLIYIKATVTEQREPSITSLDWHNTNILLNKNILLDFALRYWPLHFRNTSIFQKDGPVGASKEFANILPTSTTVVQLQNTLWEKYPTAVLLFYRNAVTSVFRQILTTNNAVTLQCTIFLAQLYQQLGKVPEAAPLFYQAAITSNTLLTTRSIVTMQLMRTFLDVTVDQMTTSKTDIMVKREECLKVLVECYKVQYGQTSESVVTILRELYQHYLMIKEEKIAQEIMISIQKITQTDYDGGDGTTGHLSVKLTSREDKDVAETGALVLDTEYDEKLEATHFDFEASLSAAEHYISEGRYELAERTFVEIWQHASKEMHEEWKMKSILRYSKFLKEQKRDYEASSVLSGFWQDTQQSNTTISESSASYFHEIAKVMKTVGLTTVALSIFKSCSEYYKSSHSHSSAYKEIQETIETTTKEVIKSGGSASSSSLEETIYEQAQSIDNVDQAFFSTVESLVQQYVSQHRWRDATRLIKRVLQGIWPSLFAVSLVDVSLPSKHVENCVNLAKRLCQCYRTRRRSTKEQDIRVRIYRSLRSGRKVEDKLRQQTTTELLQFFEMKSQTDLVINVHKELLNDYIEHYGPEHPIVVKQLWILAEKTRPRPVFLDYYQQIIQILNKDSKISHPEAFEPLVLVATELWNQSRYSDALNLYRVIFTTFLEKDSLSQKFKDYNFVQEIFDRYTHCLRTVRTEFTTLHHITTVYQTKCKATFGMSASITVQATLTLARLCQETKLYESEAITLYEELLKIKSDIVNHQEISATLDSMYEDQADIVSSAGKEESISSHKIQKAVQILKKRVESIRHEYGWAHEESLSKMKEIVSMHAKHNEISSAVSELKETTVKVLSSNTSAVALATAAATIASSYIAIGQTQKVTELAEEVYRQTIMKDTSNSKNTSFDLSSKEHHSLIFLAQLQHSLHRGTLSVTQILASLTTEYVYYEEFRKQLKSQSSTLHSTSLSASRLYHFLIKNSHQMAAARVFEEFKNYFLSTEGKRIQVNSAQAEVFLQTILEHFRDHRSQNFTRSVGIFGNKRVVELLREKKYDAASNLAMACFKYISAQKNYNTPAIVKFVFSLGMNVSGYGHIGRSKDPAQQQLLSTSALIIQDALRVVRELKLNLAQLDPENLNGLIGLLGEQKDYKTLDWLLTTLWNSREVQQSWQPRDTLALGRRYIIARFLVSDTMAALRLAEDIVYNCRRVHGPRHSSTLEMSVLLSQLYTSVGQKYQAHKDGAEIAKRYYKKSAALHENILRAFSDPTLVELETNLDASMSMDGTGSAFDFDVGEDTSSENAGAHVRQHLKLLKLAVERLGDWPKDYSEYQRLNADVVQQFPTETKGVDGVDKWNLKSFGGGKAESNEDLVDVEVNDWRLFETRELVANGQ